MSWDDGTPYLEEVGAGLYAYIQPTGGWMVNNTGTIVDASGRAILIDTAATEKRNRAILASVAEVSTGAPRVLINTHHHPDHVYGNCFLPPETLIVAHDRCRELVLRAGTAAMKELTEPDYGNITIRPPELTVNDRLTIHAEGFPVELHTVAPAHTSNDVIVWLPQQRVLYAGDLAFNGGQPIFLDGSAAGYIRAVEFMRSLEPEVLVGGHGPVTRGDAVATLLDDLQAYAEFVVRIAAEGVAAGRTPLETAQRNQDNPFHQWAETERLVANVARASFEADPSSVDGTRLAVPFLWPDMEALHGGPIVSHA